MPNFWQINVLHLSDAYSKFFFESNFRDWWMSSETKIDPAQLNHSYVTLYAIRTAISLLQTTVCDIASHNCTILSNPAVRNCGRSGCAARAHSSSVCPSTTGLKPSANEPIKIQFFVEPTSSCEPRPSDSARMPPRCSAIWKEKKSDAI